MDIENLDFEGTEQVVNNTTSTNESANGEDVTSIDGKEDVVDIGNQSQPGEENGNNDGNDGDGISSTGELNSGDEIEVDGNTYTVDANGNIVDKDNNIFKEAKDVKEWLAGLDVEDDNTEFDISKIQDAIGVSVTDENGKPVEFTNDVEGVKNYVNSVIELKSNEIQQGAINKLYADNPILKQFVDYCQINGTYQGFGDIPDRSGYVIDKDNVAQQEYIIRMAAEEFGNKSMNDSYINYLKDTGKLYDEAIAQLEALQHKDEEYKAQIAQQAQEARIREQEELQAYWKTVSDAIDSRTIAGYKIPETFVKTVNGQKLTFTPNDFYNYLSRAVETENGARMTAYQRDLNNLSDKDALDKELLQAWLMFTGGSYKDLVDMAIKEDAVKKLRLKSKENRTKKTVKINKATSGKVDLNDIVL